MRRYLAFVFVLCLLIGCGTGPTPTPAPTPVPLLAEHDEVVVVSRGGVDAGMWDMSDGCQRSSNPKIYFREGARAVVLTDRCYDSLTGDHYYNVAETKSASVGWMSTHF